MMEDSCELCEKTAMMLCESDQAKLCWECDEKVHSANFLVAKHSRVLLCRLCHSPTPWKASGTKLTPTMSFCHRCVVDRHTKLHQFVNNNNVNVEDAAYDHHHLYVDVDDDDVDQVRAHVRPTYSSSATSPSAVAGAALQFKRLRNNSFSVDSHDGTETSSSEMLSATLPNGDESTSMRVSKRHRVDQPNH